MAKDSWVDMDIKVVKVPAVMAGTIRLQPEFDDALEKIGARLEKKGKGAGERRNELNRSRVLEGQRIAFQISHHPRSTGLSKIRKSRMIFQSMVPNVIRSMVKKIAARWEAEGGL